MQIMQTVCVCKLNSAQHSFEFSKVAYREHGSTQSRDILAGLNKNEIWTV